MVSAGVRAGVRFDPARRGRSWRGSAWRSQRRRHARNAAGAPVRFSVLTRPVTSAAGAAVSRSSSGRSGLPWTSSRSIRGGIFKRFGDRRLRRHLLRPAVQLHRPGAEPRLLAQLRHEAFLESRRRRAATEWEKRIDELMQEQSQARDLAERQRAFAEVQRIIGDELPAIYFVAPE